MPTLHLPARLGARALALAAAGLVAFALEPVAQTLDDAAATVPSDLTLPDALAALDTLEAQGKWSEAIEPATRMADAVAEQSGADSLRYAEALTRLAEVQRRTGDPAKAELGFARAISIIEARTGGLSGRLIDPLRGLGFSYADMRDHARAAIVLERAVLTLRRNRGLFDPSQLKVLERLATSQTANREFADAEQTLRYSVRVAEQSYGARDPRVAGPMSRLADWYSSVFAYDVARSFYRTAIERVEEGAGPMHPALVDPLRGLAENSMRAFIYGDVLRRDTPMSPTPAPSQTAMMFDQTREDPRPGNRRRLSSESQEALERALAILRTRPEGTTGLQLVITLLRAGDWYLVKNEIDPAHARYSEAWKVSRTEPDVVAATQASEPDETVLGYPVVIYFPGGGADRPGADIPEAEVIERYVLAEFDVGTDGRLASVELIDSDASDRQIRETLGTLEASVYRPRYVDGAPVATQDVRFRDVFRERRRQEDSGKAAGDESG